jgi:hypothetical protein
MLIDACTQRIATFFDLYYYCSIPNEIGPPKLTLNKIFDYALSTMDESKIYCNEARYGRENDSSFMPYRDSQHLFEYMKYLNAIKIHL